MRVLLPTERSSCTQRHTPSSPTTKPPAFLLRLLPTEYPDFCTAGRPLSPLQRSLPYARKGLAHPAKRPKLPLIVQEKPGLSRTDLIQTGKPSGAPDRIGHAYQFRS